MGFPAFLLFGREGFREVAGPVAPHQLRQSRVVKPRAGRGQLGATHGAQVVQGVPVVVAHKAAVQVLVHIGRRLLRPGEHGGPDAAHVRQAACHLRMRCGLGQVNAPALRQRRREGVHIAHHHGGFVEVDGLDGQARHALGQVCRAGEHAQANVVHIQGGQLARVVRQVPGNQLVLVGGVAGQRPHHRQAAPLCREHARHMQKRPRRERRGGQAQLGRHAVFLVQRQGKVKQLGVVLANEPRQRNGGAHVRQRIVRGLVHQAVGFGEVFQLEAGRAIFLLRPVDAIGPQRIRHAHHVQQIPPAALVLPLARIGVDEVAPEHEARDFIVKPDGVVAHANGAGLRKLGLDAVRKLALGQAFFQAQLGGDAGDEARLRIGQVVVGGPAVDHQRLTDLVELGIGADGGKLRRAIQPRVGTKGFVVVPEKGVRGHGARWENFRLETSAMEKAPQSQWRAREKRQL